MCWLNTRQRTRFTSPSSHKNRAYPIPVPGRPHQCRARSTSGSWGSRAPASCIMRTQETLPGKAITGRGQVRHDTAVVDRVK